MSNVSSTNEFEASRRGCRVFLYLFPLRMCKLWLRLSNTRPLIYPDFCMFNGSLPSKVCLADKSDLKKSNKRKQAPNDAALLSARCAIWSCWALWATRRKGSTLALFCLLSAPKQHWTVYDETIVTPCHPWESWRFNFPSSTKHSSVLLCWQLDFPFPLSAWFCLSFCPQTFWFPFCFLIQHIQCEHLRWICVLFFKPKLYFCGLFCIWCTQTPMINKCL